jgi:hypothetical protein
MAAPDQRVSGPALFVSPVRSDRPQLVRTAYAARVTNGPGSTYGPVMRRDWKLMLVRDGALEVH